MSSPETFIEDDANGRSAPEKYYGKYRGIVVNNVDPEQRGRIQAIVPDVSTVIPTTWAMPCLPVGGIQMGMFTVPLIGAGVWIEFEQGDPDFPVWVGCFWGTAAEVPTMARTVPPAVPGITLQTPLQNGITISDVPGPTGGILLKTAAGALISVSSVGITISNGQGATIMMNGPSVSINETALVIT
jgi:uncharacterized protein involved in type VI secretion and phage assembly